MVTYPSTYGVFEEEIKTIIDCVHSHGGQVRISLTGLTMAVSTCSEVSSINTINRYASEVGNPHLLPSILLLIFSLLLSLLSSAFLLSPSSSSSLLLPIPSLLPPLSFLFPIPSLLPPLSFLLLPIPSLLPPASQVYMDGANMNAQVALTSPGSIGEKEN